MLYLVTESQAASSFPIVNKKNLWVTLVGGLHLLKPQPLPQSIVRVSDNVSNLSSQESDSLFWQVQINANVREEERENKKFNSVCYCACIINLFERYKIMRI